MPQVVPDEGELLLMNQIVTQWNASALQLALYVNNYVPVHSSTVLDFTEAAFPGYARKNLSSWSPPLINAAGQALTDHPIQTFTMTGSSPAETVYGFFVVDPVVNTVVFAQDNGAPFPMDQIGAQYSVLLQFTGASEF